MENLLQPQGRMQAKAIPDSYMIATVWTLARPWASLWAVERAMPWCSYRVVRAKLRGLVKRGLLTGCACGCRGDFEVTAKGKEMLECVQL